MPHEDRRIIFDYAEMYKAIYALCLQKEMQRPPPGEIIMVQDSPEDRAMMVVDFENKLEHRKATISYSRDFIAAALMLYCRTSRIPLPKNAQKSVMLLDDAIVLRVQI